MRQKCKEINLAIQSKINLLVDSERIVTTMYKDVYEIKTRKIRISSELYSEEWNFRV